MKKLKIGSFLAAIVWTVIMVFAVVHNASNDRFTVTHFEGIGYKVEASPSWAWDQSKGFGRTLGWVFLAGMWVMTFVVAADLHLGKRTNDPSREQQAARAANTKGFLMVGVPLLLSVIFFFANYSSIYSNNYVQVSDSQFTQWQSDGKIEKKGEKTWVDATEDNVLLHAFDNKQVIK